MPGEDEILVVSPSAAAGAVLLLLGSGESVSNGEGSTCWDCDLRMENDPSFLSVTDWGRGASRRDREIADFGEGEIALIGGGKPGGVERGDRSGCRADTERG